MDKKLFSDFYRGKKVLVTGNTGFKGSWLTAWLLDLGAEVFGISDRVPTEPSMFEALGLEKRIVHKYLNVNDAVAIREEVSKICPDVIFHLAAQPIVSVSYSDPLNTFQTNVMGTLNVMDAVRHNNKPCVLVCITSDKCYENVEWTWGYRENDALGGKDPYSASKACAEIAFKSYFKSFFHNTPEICVATARAGNVIGGGDWALNRIVPDTIRSWSNNAPVSIRNPYSTRPWQHVLEPLGGYLLLGKNVAERSELTGEAFNFGPLSEQNQSVINLLKEMSQYWSIDFNEKVKYEKNLAFHEAGLLKLNCDKALNLLEWKPVLNFTDAARLTSLWYLNYYKAKGLECEQLFSFTVAQIKEYIYKAQHKELTWTTIAK